MDSSTQRNEQLLINAFDEQYRKELEKVRADLETHIKRFANDLTSKLDSLLGTRIIVESRVKRPDSFAEKIRRKGYASRWTVSGNPQTDKELISTSLPDLIGVRMNCMFSQQEKILYEALQKADPSLLMNFDENNKMQNGRPIYKVTGSYEWPANEKRYNFELQIKSYVNSLWGEVEHKTCYKTHDFPVAQQLRQEVVDQTIKVLEATDKQLHTLFHHTYNKNDLIKGLFYLQTKDAVAQKCGHDILAVHYNRFFRIMLPSEQLDMQCFVASGLREGDYLPACFDSSICDSETKELAKRIEGKYGDYDMEPLYAIASSLRVYENGQHDFLLHLSMICLRTSDDVFEESGIDENDAFSGDELCESAIETQIKRLDLLFKKSEPEVK